MEPQPPRSRLVRGGWFVAGMLLTGLGLVGAVLPIMPTVIFLILAAGCFARSSPRMEAWILNHPLFGGHVRAWRERQAISPRGKLFACGGIAGGFISFWLVAEPTVPLAAATAALLAAIGAYILTRPD